jgi:four helix bundle protein
LTKNRLQATSHRLQATGCGLQASGGRMKSYKDLEIYKIAHDLAIRIHKMTLEKLPQFEMYEEGRQIRKSSKSICATIVEGFGRKQYQQEYVKFLTYSLASLDETKEHLELLFKTASLTDEDMYHALLSEYKELGKKIYRFRETIIRDLEG